MKLTLKLTTTAKYISFRNIKDYNTLNNYVKKLKDKNAIELTDDGYKLHRLLRNEENVTVTVVRGR